MRIDDVVYPAIFLFNDDNRIYAKSKGNRIIAANSLHMFENAIILDSNGTVFEVDKAINTGWAYFWGWLPLIYAERCIKVDYCIKNKYNVDLISFKEIILKRLNMGLPQGHWWYKKKDIPDLIVKMNNSKNFKEIVEVFMYDIR